MLFNTKKWIKFSIANILIVASLGVVMRYKIAFDFPFFSQKHIQLSHSHFAFIGWITHTLYVLLIDFIQKKKSMLYLKQLQRIMIANLLCSYVMLFSFILSGYSALSIVFSTFTIIISCFFAYYVFKEAKNMNYHPSIAWFKIALILNILSSLGTFYLAYITISKQFDEHAYLASIYFYLHFQYNGFFIFTCLGLAINEIMRWMPKYKYNKITFMLFASAVFPCYFLSTLWADLPLWLYIIVVIAAFLQLAGWIKFLSDIKKAKEENNNLSNAIKYLFIFVAIAFSVKLLLQLGSTIPSLSKLAFGFRPIVIAYLHLVLLAVVSMFLFTYIYSSDLLSKNKSLSIGLSSFAIGVFLNELVLGIQGIASLQYILIKYVNETLYAISLLIFVSVFLMLASQITRTANQ